MEGVAKSLKALNHEGHEGHKGKEKLFFVLFVSFVVPFFSEPFATPAFDVVARGLEKNGTRKARRAQSSSGLAAPGKQKRLPLP